jgi:FAD-dependent urate hydroxylase
MFDADVAIVGAGPYGLSAAAHLRRRNIDVRVLGDPMSFWRTMPIGMVLRSNWTATCIAEYTGQLSLDSFCAATGARFSKPIPLDRFVEYGTWVQGQVAPDVDRRVVRTLDKEGNGFQLRLEDGHELSARRVVVAAGIASFPNRPSVAAHLPAELVSHTSDHRDLSKFAGARVLVVGGGQSALESAALMHESGANVEVAVRADHLNWLSGGKYHRVLGRYTPIAYAPTDVGPMGLSRVVAVPDFFRRLPRAIQDPAAYRAIRPAGAAWLIPRLRDVPMRMNRSVASLATPHGQVEVTFADGDTLTVDHVLFGTGYRVDIARYPFLAPALLAGVKRIDGYPLLRRGLESSVPGLHFLGAPAARSFGPIMRFVSGGWYAAQTLAQRVADDAERNRPRSHESLIAATGDAG